MTCPKCGGKTLVVGTKSDGESIQRRRMCDECRYVFYTEECEVEGSDKYNDLVNFYMKKRKKP